jgi:hypothetical protein
MGATENVSVSHNAGCGSFKIPLWTGTPDVREDDPGHTGQGQGGLGMAVDIEAAREIVRKYADDVRAVMPVVRIILFGPYGDGTARDPILDDINVCVVLKDYGGKTANGIIHDLVKLAMKYDLFIFPSPYLQSEPDAPDEFLEGLLEDGIEV